MERPVFFLACILMPLMTTGITRSENGPCGLWKEVPAVREATIHIVDGKADDIHFDGQEGMGIDAFLLITHRRNVEEGHFLAFGNSGRIGKMLYNFYLNCLRNDYWELGETMEQVAQDILDVARAARGRPWPLEKAGADDIH